MPLKDLISVCLVFLFSCLTYFRILIGDNILSNAFDAVAKQVIEDVEVNVTRFQYPTSW